MKPTSPDGFWEQIGYGNILELRDSAISVYDITKQHCNLSYSEELLEYGKILDYTQDTLTIKHGIDKWRFTRLDSLPDLCKGKDSINSDPRINFEVFWDTFNEHYASFELKKVDWKKVYDTYKPGINENTTDLELYSTFREMISLLDDGHVNISASEDVEEAYQEQNKKARPKYGLPDEFEIHREIAEIYVDSLRNYNAGVVRYGVIDESIGYIQVNFMFMLADYGLSQDLSLRDFINSYWKIAGESPSEIQREEEVSGINTVMDEIIKEMDGVSAIILDLRFNIGGKDGAGLAILNHFTEKEQLAFTKKAKWNDGFTEKQEVLVSPSEAVFPGNVYLLTSHKTASASEILILGSFSNSKFIRIGSATEGIFSSTLDKKLPNGWTYELSNEVYQDLNGLNYEGTGILPDHDLEYSDNLDEFLDLLTSDLNQGRDRAIELVMKLEMNESDY